MRIAYVSTDAGVPAFGCKGASVHVQGIVRAFVRAGHEVHLLTPRPGDAPPAWADAVTLHQLPARLVSAQATGVVVDAAVGRILQDAGPFDLVYERHALWSRGAMTSARSLGIPGLLEVNAPLIEEHVAHRGAIDVEAATQIARDAIEHAALVIAVSEAVADATRRLAPRQARVQVEANGIDLDRFLPPDNDTARPFTIGFLGTLKPWHGLSVLAPLLQEVRRRLPNAELLIVGDGPAREPLTAQLASTGLAHACGWAGAVPPDKVGHWLARMDVGLAPYPADAPCYFSPLKVVEYMAAGVPVVASALGQLPDLLEHGHLGMLVPPGDVGALAAACLTLHADPARRLALRDAARSAVARTRTWDAVLARILRATDCVAGVAVAS